MERYHLPTHMKHAMPTKYWSYVPGKQFATVRLLGLDDDEQLHGSTATEQGMVNVMKHPIRDPP